MSLSMYMKGNTLEDHSEWSQGIEKESLIISNRKSLYLLNPLVIFSLGGKVQETTLNI